MNNTVIRYVLNWTEENIYTDSGIEDLVKEVGYSRRTLEIWFRRSCGISPGKYLMQRRMSRAAVLLRMTTLSITEIAILFHFHSSQNFARAFRKFTGLIPSEYRKRDKWFVQALRKPLLLEDIVSMEPELYNLQDLIFHGSATFCKSNFASFSMNDSIVNKIRSTISLQKKNGKGDVCIACKPIPSMSLSDGRSSIIDVEMYTECLTRAETTYTIPGGKFMQFHFRGSWREYVVFTRIIYFKIVEKKVCRRNGFDLTFFSFSPGDVEEVICRHLIPVE
ncbi:helix-turn-helix domain-containing protein [Yokenella regensburgei]|uniref:helix-turn-helix domain-containing protein n=1 Tax=Yokenella regensburgei TaxID=158877 RepID=UPI0014329CDB|nr:helix-turn-helix domain-containing protein [Yokenella regensburgei]QIU92595.1 helix-turn-helix transcriptional regulator [Yokenella regensburgei]